MNQIVTEGIVLARTDYGEADRILTLLTPDQGKLRLMAKGVRRVKSKLAGGIELFSVSSITFIRGRGDIGTLVSARLAKYYDTIVKDLDRTMVGYDLIKQINKITEDEPGSEYFDLLRRVFEALDDSGIPLPVVRLWFLAQMLTIEGHAPNLHFDESGKRLQPDQTYDFNTDQMCFRPSSGRGRFTADDIKFLRLLFSGNAPKTLSQVEGSGDLVRHSMSVIDSMTAQHV